jgi:hypothetical protein
MQQGKGKENTRQQHLVKSCLSDAIRPAGAHLLHIAQRPTNCPQALAGPDRRIPKET